MWDGHHRVCAIHLGGRNYIDEEEYVILHLTYKMAMSVNLDAGFVTPFDPRKEACNSGLQTLILPQVRKRDFLGFKKQVLEMRRKKEKLDTELEDFIIHNKSIYSKPRTVKTIIDMIRRIETKSRL